MIVHCRGVKSKERGQLQRHRFGVGGRHQRTEVDAPAAAPPSSSSVEFFQMSFSSGTLFY